MSGWEHAAAAFRIDRAPTEQQQQAIADVRHLAAEYNALRPAARPALLSSILELTTPRQRALAMMFTEPGTPDWLPLVKLIAAIVTTQPGVQTNHGWFSADDITNRGVRLRDEPHSNVVPIHRTPEWWEGTGTEDVPF